MDPKELALLTLANIEAPRPGEVYRHYKGGLYSIVAVAIDEGTLEPIVVYHSNARGTDWARTLGNFTEFVGDAPRFVRERA